MNQLELSKFRSPRLLYFPLNLLHCLRGTKPNHRLGKTSPSPEKNLGSQSIPPDFCVALRNILGFDQNLTDALLALNSQEHVQHSFNLLHLTRQKFSRRRRSLSLLFHFQVTPRLFSFSPSSPNPTLDKSLSLTQYDRREEIPFSQLPR